MELNQDLCYRAAESRDPRFDGRFFTAVTSTGIYCRPICPARTPMRKHMRFYSCAAAAEEAGFRPCRRCRPDTAPGSPAWVGTSAVVTRGLRFIAQGALDQENVEALAARLGLGERQLRRLFVKCIGASPGSLARTRRVHFARQLIDQTTLPMTEVALAAGFSSLRQFNASVKETFGQAPSALRSRGAAAREGEWLELRLPYRSPFDWRSLIAFLAPRAIPGVEQVTPEFYRRSVDCEGAAGLLEVRPAGGSAHLLFRLRPPATRGLIELVQRARSLFDCDADLLPVVDQLGKDPRLRDLVRARPGLRLPGAWDGFELGVRAILGQQVTVAAATTLAGRLARAFGRPFGGDGAGVTHLFPSPAALAEADIARLGLPRARAEAVRGLARAVAEGRISLTPAAPLLETRAGLRAIPGIGPWTVEYIAMRALRDPDAFPKEDLGLLRFWPAGAQGARATVGRGAAGAGRTSAAELERRAEPWRPWRSYAVMHLWTAADLPREETALKTRRNHAHSN